MATINDEEYDKKKIKMKKNMTMRSFCCLVSKTEEKKNVACCNKKGKKPPGLCCFLCPKTNIIFLNRFVIKYSRYFFQRVGTTGFITIPPSIYYVQNEY